MGRDGDRPVALTSDFVSALPMVWSVMSASVVSVMSFAASRREPAMRPSR